MFGGDTHKSPRQSSNIVATSLATRTSEARVTQSKTREKENKDYTSPKQVSRAGLPKST